ncbi:FxLD family lanthipeptide [Streptomyces sp. SID3343]|uniref:FxLD family lanthipeptide n=1 Tax=Streptomyces sp. SID3343 TaxID=2690260 RepID=UPI0013713B7D|nr:FxLD family lanthipeptide [Streptomyces sp. SID3343]MYV98364.1 FxLD family lantipeptide [Streptomyces sp. SID3343]
MNELHGDGRGATALAQRPGTEDEFTLDVRVVVTENIRRRGDCPTNDGCGNTCQGDASACNSFVDDPA